MENRFCIECGVEFEAKRADAKFCSNACRMANKRKMEKDSYPIGFDPQIRGSKAGDVPVTALGQQEGLCKSCGVKYRRWIESKIARLVRNEIEGVHWGAALELDQEKFHKLKEARMAGWSYCSDDCMNGTHKPAFSE